MNRLRFWCSRKSPILNEPIEVWGFLEKYPSQMNRLSLRNNWSGFRDLGDHPSHMKRLSLRNNQSRIIRV